MASAIIDGEAVMYDEQGRSDFNLLQASLGGRAGRKTSPAQFVAFDLVSGRPQFPEHRASRSPSSPRRPDREPGRGQHQVLGILRRDRRTTVPGILRPRPRRHHRQANRQQLPFRPRRRMDQGQVHRVRELLHCRLREVGRILQVAFAWCLSRQPGRLCRIGRDRIQTA